MAVLILLIAAIVLLRALAGDPSTQPAAFVVDGDQATMNGVIGPGAAVDLALVLQDGDVTKIVMTDVSGSRDYAVFVDIARLLRDNDIATHVPADGVIAGGGVDFFLAGATRTFDSGASFGVRSWADETGVQGRDLFRDDPLHDPYLDYFAEIDVPADFYWFALSAAPADSIHTMTTAELQEFGFRT